MNNYLVKLRHILPTFFLISFVTIGGYSAFRWLFSIQYEIINIKEDLWEAWLPFILSWIPVLIWLRPKLWILNFKDNDKGRFFFQFLAAFTITASLIITQMYLTTSTGKLQKLKVVEEISEVEKARYYTISRFYPLPWAGSTHSDFRTSGKYNQHFNITIYFTCPIISDTLARQFPQNWYGMKYQKQISNKLSSPEKEEIHKAFFEECLQKMNSLDYQKLEYFERTPHSDDRDGYLKAIKNQYNILTDGLTILEPQAKPFAARNGGTFGWIFKSYGIGLAIFLFSLVWPKLSRTELLRQKKGQKPKQDDLRDAMQYLIPQGHHFVTSIILNLNLLAFLSMFFSGVNPVSPSGTEMLNWGGNRQIEVMQGEWWRLVSHMFVHGGIMHLVLNIFGLVVAAMFIEPILGRRNYFILYLLAGIFAGLCSNWWSPNTISVGASGAIFGLHGGLLGLLLTNAIPRDGKKLVLILIGLFVGSNLIFGFIVSGIDNAAHIGGLLSGALLAVALYSFKVKAEEVSV